MGSAPMSGQERRKRTITEIRGSKTTGEKMVYTSVPDYTSARWAEMAGVGVCVVGDSLAMVAHGHPSTIPATMDMMVMHALAVRRGAPDTFVLRSEEHTSEIQSLMRISYAVFCLKKK